MPTPEKLQQLFAKKKQQPQEKVNVLAETFKPANLLQSAKTVGKSILGFGKELISPTRSTRTKEEITQAKPTLKEKGLGVAKFGGEIFDVAESVGHFLSKPQRILVSKLFPDFNERNEKQRDEIKAKLKEFNIPATAGEEQVMKVADVLSFIPAGVLKAKNIVIPISKISKSVKAGEIAEHLKNFNIADELVPKVSKVLETVNNERQVSNIVRTAEIASDIIKKTGTTPPPQILSKIGESLDEFSALPMDKRERVIEGMVSEIIESAPKTDDLTQQARKYKTTINIQDKNDLEYLSRILSQDQIADIKAGKMTNFRGTPYEDLARVNIISETPKTIEQQLAGKIKEVKLKSDTFYHGTSAENAQGIMRQGFKKGSDLPENNFRGGGYGKMQSSVSFTETPKDASRFSTLVKNGEIVEAKLKPNSKVVSIEGVEDAVDLEDYMQYLKKNKIDAVYIGGGEKELVVINPKAIKPTKSQLTDIWNKSQPLQEGVEKVKEIVNEREENIMMSIEKLLPTLRKHDSDLDKYAMKNEDADFLEGVMKKLAERKKVPDDEQKKAMETLARYGKGKEAFGVVAGVETDEEGKVGFDPMKAVLGVAGVKAVKNIEAEKIINEAQKAYKIAKKEKFAIFKRSQKEVVTAKNEGALKRGIEKLFTPISTRLGKISPELKPAMRKVDYETGIGILRDTKKTLPFLKAQAKLSVVDREIFDLARKNGDEKVINAIADKYGFSKELQETRKVLDDIYEKANAVGMEVKYRGDYFPRIIKDPKGFMNYLYGTDDWSMVQKAIEEKASKLGIKPTDLSIEDKAGIVNNLLRGYGDKITLSIPGHAKERQIEFLTKELDKFYEKSDASLVSYIVRMNEEIAGRKFFGKELGVNPEELNSADSIGAYVMKLISDGKIKPSQEREISDILKSRFNKGKMNEALQVFRNVEYLSTMGNPISAVTQIGDMGWSLAESGFYRTMKGLGKSIFGKGIKKEDLGIERIAQEFTEPSRTAKLVEKTFKAVGLDKMDRLGKETFINAYWDKIQRLAKKGDQGLTSEFKTMFGNNANQVLQDTANGKLTDDTKFALFSRLADFQPISKSEMPEKYLSLPNGRIFYMLKSFTIKQVDVFRREAISQIVSGDARQKAKGIQRLVILGGMFMLANATSDEIKDLILGRKTSANDRLIDNLVRLGGLSKFDIYKIREEGLGMGIAKKILFPTSIADALSKDIENIITQKEYKTGKLKGEQYKYEIPQRVPIVGKMYYWWFGRGQQKTDYKEAKETPTKKTPPKKVIPTKQIAKKKIIPSKKLSK
jgi:hypothetical protein